jgi:hypothetical protein
MRGREPIVVQRRRRVPPQFSWVDHRLVRDGHIQGRSTEALALYLLLVTVCDADGLSWYSGPALCRLLSWSAPQLRDARRELRAAELIAYRKPLYQVLDLSPTPVLLSRKPRSKASEPVAIGDVLGSLLAGGAR